MVKPLRVLYITFDGLLQPLGRGQVMAYVLGLARIGIEFSVISLERPHDLADKSRLGEVTGQLASAGVVWVHVDYAAGGARAMVTNCRLAQRAVRKCIAQWRPNIIHARSYPPAALAWWAARHQKIPYLFDMRGYWVDEKRGEGSRFTSPLSYAVAKAAERALIRRAAAVVTLTKLQAEDVRRLRLPASAETHRRHSHVRRL